MNSRKMFDSQLDELSVSLIRMGAEATDAIKKALDALLTGNKDLARQVIDGDKHIDEMERNIEQQCLRLLLRQQPVAGDLRRISTVLKIITDIERIGDHASDISEISLYIDESLFPDVEVCIESMAAAACEMSSDAVKAYVHEDLDLAKRTRDRDDIVDEHFHKIREILGKSIGANPGNIHQALDYLMIAKYLERVGDHAENICEWVEFCATGVHKNERII